MEFCNSFPVKRGIWEKVIPSPDKTDIKRWQRPDLAHFANFNRIFFLINALSLKMG